MAFSINDLNYEKDSKERMPWEHYTQEFAAADPVEIASRLSIPYDEETKKLTLTFLGTQYQITWPELHAPIMTRSIKKLINKECVFIPVYFFCYTNIASFPSKETISILFVVSSP